MTHHKKRESGHSGQHKKEKKIFFKNFLTVNFQILFILQCVEMCV